jgi:heparanase 1
LGNELEHKVTANVMAEDYVTLRNMINEMWPDPSSRPWLIGPDENPDGDYLKDFLQGAGHVINASTYHVYPGYGLDPKLPNEILTVDYLNKEGSLAESLGSIISSSAPGVEGWVGETAAAWHSGQYNTTNTFLSGFWYLDALSSVAAADQKAFCRQTLIGGNYELLDKNTTEPYPDYYTALLFKRLMGQKILSVKVDSTIQQWIRAYASCTAPDVEEVEEGAVTLAFLNINNSTSFNLTIANVSESMADREEFHLSTGEGGNLRSHTMKLNGNLLQLQDDKLPPLSGQIVSGSAPLTIQPLTYGYAVLKNVNAHACK